MHRQLGTSLSGLTLFLLLIGLGLYTAARVGPAYLDHWVVQRALDRLAALPETKDLSDAELRERFASEMNVNNVTVVDARDLEIERIAGGVRLAAAFAVQRPFLGNVSLHMDFRPEAASR